MGLLSEYESLDGPSFQALLVGTRVDLREDPATVEQLAKNEQQPVSRSAGQKMAKEIRAVKYLECSAMTHRGVKEVFDEAIIVALEPPARKRKKRKEGEEHGACSLL